MLALLLSPFSREHVRRFANRGHAFKIATADALSRIVFRPVFESGKCSAPPARSTSPIAVRGSLTHARRSAAGSGSPLRSMAAARRSAHPHAARRRAAGAPRPKVASAGFFAILLHAPTRVRALRAIAGRLGPAQKFRQHRKHAVRHIGRRAQAMMKAHDIGGLDFGDGQGAPERADVAVNGESIQPLGRWLAPRLDLSRETGQPRSPRSVHPGPHLAGAADRRHPRRCRGGAGHACAPRRA